MAILESNITIRSSKRPSDSSDERPSKSKRELMSSQMNDVLQSMVEAAKARIEASKAKAERYKRIRVIANCFRHLTETVDRQFKETVKAICRLGKFIIRPSQSNEVHPLIANNTKFFPYFKKCIGAIDGTYISAWAPTSKLVSYRNRKAIITHNIMCSCDFDMKFTFVYTGWEGGYYLVDSDYPCTLGFLPPYRTKRYHLRDFRGGDHLEGAKELFNYRHSSLRNVIERCFGVLKARFPVLKMMPRYKPCRQVNVMRACCTIHNFIRMATRNDRLFTQFNVDNLTVEGEGRDNSGEPSHTVDLINH
ncbi:uncharacterized protein LOC115990304 [Quercus lobata]|uniref:uncharacterized protein LOC115990304 n=1 Tax=Quercus lobata TaxID=97700 RepID=UPI0012487127|nr:uncharacterized protein LOC115990304 [Quercus lobata]